VINQVSNFNNAIDPSSLTPFKWALLYKTLKVLEKKTVLATIRLLEVSLFPGPWVYLSNPVCVMYNTLFPNVAGGQ